MKGARRGRVWIHGRRAGTRDVAARMPADYISRLLLFASICAVWEALAKSLPDQGAFGKLAIRGMQHNEEMGVVAFLWLLSTNRRCLRRCALISCWLTGGAFLGGDLSVVSAGKRWFDGADSLISTRWFHREGHAAVCAQIQHRCVV